MSKKWTDEEFTPPPKKRAISIRLDEDVLKFFKEGGNGYQRRINNVLRLYLRAREAAR